MNLPISTCACSFFPRVNSQVRPSVSAFARRWREKEEEGGWMEKRREQKQQKREREQSREGRGGGREVAG